MKFAGRVSGILFRPGQEWPRIKAEPSSPGRLMVGYAAGLAAIPAAAKLAGYWIMLSQFPAGAFLPRAAASLVTAVISYAIALAMIYVVAFVIKAFAPAFDSRPDLTGAMKLAVYSMTPVWLAGLAGLIYGLPLTATIAVAVAAGLYGFRLLFLGFKAGLMDTPGDKTAVYFVVCIVVIIVPAVVLSLVMNAISLMLGAMGTAL